MDGHDPLRARIQDCTRYKDLLKLRDTVWSMSAKLDFSTYMDLRKRVDQRMDEFENPTCEDFEIKIHFPGSKPAFMDMRECRIIATKGTTLPEYVFSKYDGADDIELIPLGVYEESYSGASTNFDPTGEAPQTGSFNPRLGILQHRIENVIKLANYMSETYSTVIPQISEDLSEIVKKLDTLYRRISNNEYELRR